MLYEDRWQQLLYNFYFSNWSSEIEELCLIEFEKLTDGCLPEILQFLPNLNSLKSQLDPPCIHKWEFGKNRANLQNVCTCSITYEGLENEFGKSGTEFEIDYKSSCNNTSFNIRKITKYWTQICNCGWNQNKPNPHFSHV